MHDDYQAIRGEPYQPPATLRSTWARRRRRRSRSSSARLARPSTGAGARDGHAAGRPLRCRVLDASRRLARLERPTRGGKRLPNAPIAITGMHRSGTSMITRALHDSGLHLIGDGRRGAHRRGRGQPRGVLGEQGHRRLQRRAAGGGGRMPGTTLPTSRPQAVDDPRVAHIADASTSAIAALSEHDHWGFKDPRTCLTAAYWLDLEPRPAVHHLRAPPARGGALAQAPQPELVLARPRAVGALLRHGARAGPRRAPDRHALRHVLRRSRGRAGAAVRVRRPGAGSHPRVRTDLRHHTIGVDLGDAGASAEPPGALRGPVPVGGRHPATGRTGRRGSGPPPHPRRCRRAATRRPAPGCDRPAPGAGAGAPGGASRGRGAAIAATSSRSELGAEPTAEAGTVARSGTSRPVATVRGTRGPARGRCSEDTAATLPALQASVATHRPADQSRAPSVVLGDRARRHVVRPLRRLADRGRRTAVAGGRSGRPGAAAVARPAGDPAQSEARAPRRARSRVPPRRSTGRRALPLRSGHGAPAPAARPAGPPSRSVALPAHDHGTRARPPRRGGAPSAGARPSASLRRSWTRSSRTQRARADRALVGRRRRRSRPRTAEGPGRSVTGGRRYAADGAERRGAGRSRGWSCVPGSPREVRDARRRAARAFPDTRDGSRSPTDLSHIAHLEAQRYRGSHAPGAPRGLPSLVPPADRAARPRRAQLPHGGRRDRRGRGVRPHPAAPTPTRQTLAVADRASSPSEWPAAGRARLDRLDLAAELRDLATFRPPDGDRLPYLDAQRRRRRHRPEPATVAEARRVAAVGVITVSRRAVGRHGSRPPQPVGSRTEVDGAARCSCGRAPTPTRAGRPR